MSTGKSEENKMGGKLIDLTGQTFGRLKALSFNGKKWECVCDCGEKHSVAGNALRTGFTKSCGCLKKELDKTHGMSIRSDGKVPPEYDAYQHAKYRCTNPNARRYKDWGGRGIKFLFTSFDQFFAELGPRPKGKTLDRIK